MDSEETSPERLAEIEAGLERGLLAAVPGLEIVDRAMAFPGGAHADLVALDEGGRLLFALLVDGDAEETSLVALDLLAQARSHLALIARHLSRPGMGPGVRADLEPRLALVAEKFSESTRSRLTPLTGERVLLLEIRELSSASHASVYLVPVPPLPLVGAPRAAAAEDFLAELSDRSRHLAESLLRRLRRLDESLESLASRDDLQWRFRGRVLASLRSSEGRLEAHLPATGEAIELESQAQLEAVLERALGRYVELLEGQDEEEDQDFDLPGDLGRGMIRPRDTGPLLTAEELEAFHD
jgi:hypothetical protein